MILALFTETVAIVLYCTAEHTYSDLIMLMGYDAVQAHGSRAAKGHMGKYMPLRPLVIVSDCASRSNINIILSHAKIVRAL